MNSEVMSVGDILSDGMNAIKSQFGSMLGLYFLFFGVNLVVLFLLGVVAASSLSAIAASALGSPTMAEDMLGTLGGGMTLIIILFYVLYILIYLAQIASMTSKASPVHDVTFGEAFQSGVRSAPILLLTGIILGIIAVIGAIVLSIVMAIVAFAGSFISGIFSIAALIGMFYLSCRLCLMTPIAAVEQQRNAITLISRSWNLTAGHGWSILLANLIFLVIVVVIGFLMIWPFLGSTGTGVAPGVGSTLMLFVGFVLLGVFYIMVQAALNAVIHGRLTGTADPELHQTFE